MNYNIINDVNFNMDIKQWNPYITYIWTTKDVQDWYDIFGSSCFYLGKLYEPTVKLLVRNRYEVKFIEKK